MILLLKMNDNTALFCIKYMAIIIIMGFMLINVSFFYLRNAITSLFCATMKHARQQCKDSLFMREGKITFLFIVNREIPGQRAAFIDHLLRDLKYREIVVSPLNFRSTYTFMIRVYCTG